MGSKEEGWKEPGFRVQTVAWMLGSFTELEEKEGPWMGESSEPSLGPAGPAWSCPAGSCMFRSATLGTNSEVPT